MDSRKIAFTRECRGVPRTVPIRDLFTQPGPIADVSGCSKSSAPQGEVGHRPPNRSLLHCWRSTKLPLCVEMPDATARIHHPPRRRGRGAAEPSECNNYFANAGYASARMRSALRRNISDIRRAREPRSCLPVRSRTSRARWLLGQVWRLSRDVCEWPLRDREAQS